MASQDDVFRELAAVRRALDDLEEEVETARGVMPETNRPADGGRQNYLTALKRVENAEELAGDAAEKLRNVLKAME